MMGSAIRGMLNSFMHGFGMVFGAGAFVIAAYKLYEYAKRKTAARAAAAN